MKTGWIVDSNGMIRFIIGVTPETPEGTGEPWLVNYIVFFLNCMELFSDVYLLISI